MPEVDWGFTVMDCSLSGVCGGCSLRHLSLIDYQNRKIDALKRTLQSITRLSPPVFISDGTRRRASMAFLRSKGKVILGFNSYQSSEVVPVAECMLLTPRINRNLPMLGDLVEKICRTKIIVKDKKKKETFVYIERGDLWITDADNGLDIVLEFPQDLNLDLRQIIFEEAHNNDEIIRISHRHSVHQQPETVMEKAKPYLNIAGFDVYIPAGTFLQPSKKGEQALIDLVLKYLGNTNGRIADLFCGVGTFSYALAKNIQNKVTAVDSSGVLLSGFQESINRQMVPNIEILNKNLFKYPLEGKELQGFSAIVFDPPRAGAKEQCYKIAELPREQKPPKIIAVSCNPHSFVRDANILISGGYVLEEVTLVDQFIYSAHSELVALFVLN